MLRAIDPRIVADLASLSTQFYKQQRAAIKNFKHVALGGTFAGSSDVGGADFDLIVDGCLVDIKSILYPRIDTMYLRQLVGYWLLDYDNALRISSAAVILVRHGHTELFDIQCDLIGTDVSAADLRQEFRRGLQETAANEPRRVRGDCEPEQRAQHKI